MLASDSSSVPRCYIILDQQRITKWEGTVGKVDIYNFFIRPWNVMWKTYSCASGGEAAQGAKPSLLLMALWSSGRKTHSYSFLKVTAGRLLGEEYLWQYVLGRFLLSLSIDVVMRCFLKAAFFYSRTGDSTMRYRLSQTCFEHIESIKEFVSLLDLGWVFCFTWEIVVFICNLSWYLIKLSLFYCLFTICNLHYVP